MQPGKYFCGDKACGCKNAGHLPHFTRVTVMDGVAAIFLNVNNDIGLSRDNMRRKWHEISLPRGNDSISMTN